MKKKLSVDEMLAGLTEVEQLLRFPTVEGHIDRAIALALSIARSAQDGGIANLAMQLMSEVHSVRRVSLPLVASDTRLTELLERLRAALRRQEGGES